MGALRVVSLLGYLLRSGKLRKRNKDLLCGASTRTKQIANGVVQRLCHLERSNFICAPSPFVYFSGDFDLHADPNAQPTRRKKWHRPEKLTSQKDDRCVYCYLWIASFVRAPLWVLLLRYSKHFFPKKSGDVSLPSLGPSSNTEHALSKLEVSLRTKRTIVYSS